MRPIYKHAFRFFGALLLAACGGSSPFAGRPVTLPADPPRGTLLQNPPELASTVTAPALLLELNPLANGQVLPLLGTPVCDVAVYHIRYATVGGANEATTGSGALMVPFGGDAQCHGPRPMLLYAHGTTTGPGFQHCRPA